MIELSHKPLIRAYNMDCIPLMSRCWQDEYDLAITDPQYGINTGQTVEGGGHLKAVKVGSGGPFGGVKSGNKKVILPKIYRGFDDSRIPEIEYFKELKRVSVNQIIWGGNYFLNYLDSTPCFIVWDKDNSGNFADCELAWTSFKTAVRKFTWRWNGMLQQNMKDKEIRIHPTQKPVSLYRWLLNNYAKPGQRILDTHGGSFSSAIACWKEGYDLDICEIDEEYFPAACERFERETRQQKLFSTPGGTT